VFYSALASAVVVIHLGFVLFAILGGLLVVWRKGFLWLHLPALIWALLIESIGWVCPLTPLENWLRVRAGETGYSGGFLEHYLLPLLYPAGLTRDLQTLLAVLLMAVNLGIYAYVFTHLKRQKQSEGNR
jgi:hypothetical protein